jgi:hypothetical protein
MAILGIKSVKYVPVPSSFTSIVNRFRFMKYKKLQFYYIKHSTEVFPNHFKSDNTASTTNHIKIRCQNKFHFRSLES